MVAAAGVFGTVADRRATLAEEATRAAMFAVLASVTRGAETVTYGNVSSQSS